MMLSQSRTSLDRNRCHDPEDCSDHVPVAEIVGKEHNDIGLSLLNFSCFF